LDSITAKRVEFMMSERETQRTSLCIKTSTSWYSSLDFNISPIFGTYNVNPCEMCCHVLSSMSEVTVGHTGCDLIASEGQTHDLPLDP
jgi:hypothetical protein